MFLAKKEKKEMNTKQMSCTGFFEEKAPNVEKMKQFCGNSIFSALDKRGWRTRENLTIR